MMQLPHTLTSIVFYKDHYLMAWSNKGYSVYNDLFTTDDFLKDITKQLQDIRITSLAPGSEDILWLGTDGNGIMKLYPRTKPFGLIATSDNGMASNRPVRAFCEVNGSLWVATKGSGIIAMSDFWAKKEPQPRQYVNAPESLDNNSVYALTRGNDGLVYIGTDAKGIGVYDTRNKKFTKWNGVKGFDQYAEFGSVYAILQDDDQSLWLGTSGYGLVHLKINRDNNGALSLGFLERFTFTNGDTGPANDIIYALAKSGQQQLWIGCRYGGLSLLEKKTRRFKTFKAFTYNGSLSNNDVLSLFEDSRNRLWVGTSYGLNYLDTKDANLAAPQFKKFTTADGLPNNTVHAISEDASGQVWVSTNKGLAKINTADGKIFYYQQADGLQSNEFSDGAVWKDASGVLYFGGTYGFNHFLPQDIRRSAWQPKLLLSGLLMGGSDNGENGYTVLDEATQHQQSFSVSRKDNFFELDMKAISFLNT
ncbi:MAG: histidine kinase, partial [Sphingobacteriales bacterium]